MKIAFCFIVIVILMYTMHPSSNTRTHVRLKEQKKNASYILFLILMHKYTSRFVFKLANSLGSYQFQSTYMPKLSRKREGEERKKRR